MSVIINDACGLEAQAAVKNSGSKKQCVPKPAFALNMVKEDFSFLTPAAARTQVAWDVAKLNKDIIPLYKIEEFSASNTEEKKYEGRHQDYITDMAVKGTVYNHIIGDCSYETIKSLKGAGYTRMFVTLSDGTFTAVTLDDLKVKGQPIASYDVGILNDSEIGGKPQNADITVKFVEHTKSIYEPDFDLKEYEGIYDVDLVQVSASATSIKLKANAGCSGSSIDFLEDGDFVVTDLTGAVQSITFVPPANGVYELNGTAFATGFNVALDGVVDKVEKMFENDEPLVITVT